MQMAHTEAGGSPDSTAVPPRAPWDGGLYQRKVFPGQTRHSEREGLARPHPQDTPVPVQCHEPARHWAGGPSGLTPIDLRGVRAPWVSGRVSLWSSLNPCTGESPEKWVSIWSPLSSSWGSQPRGGGGQPGQQQCPQPPASVLMRALDILTTTCPCPHPAPSRAQQCREQTPTVSTRLQCLLYV